MDINPTSEQLDLLRRIDSKLQQVAAAAGTLNFIVLVTFILSLGHHFFGWHTPTIFQ